MKIVPAQRNQIDDWLRLRQVVYTGIDQPFHWQEIETWLGDATKECLLAISDSGQTVGMVELSLRNVVDGCLSSPVGYIEGIVVDAEHRGCGVAAALVEHAEQWFRSQGCTEMATDAEWGNESAQRFHEHCGFQETYRIVQYRKPL